MHHPMHRPMPHHMRQHAQDEAPLLTPNVLICSVGSEIFYRAADGRLLPDAAWEARLDQGWDRAAVEGVTSSIPQLRRQVDSEQRRHKLSYHLTRGTPEQDAAVLQVLKQGHLPASRVAMTCLVAAAARCCVWLPAAEAVLDAFNFCAACMCVLVCTCDGCAAPFLPMFTGTQGWTGSQGVGCQGHLQRRRRCRRAGAGAWLHVCGVCGSPRPSASCLPAPCLQYLIKGQPTRTGRQLCHMH